MKQIGGKIVSILIAVVLIVGCYKLPTRAVESDYEDTVNHWAESSIKRWSEYDIVQGSNGEFNPDGQLTCAQLATILARLLKLPAAPDAGFTDNPSNAWYYNAIIRCAAAGILKGNGDGTVTPNAPISRERAMVMLSRALGIELLDSTDLSEFSDAALVSTYAQGYIAALIKAGIVGGVTADCLAPQENITRAATVTVLDRAISIYANENGKEIDASNAAGIILIVAENVKVINAPNGVKVIVADSADHTTVNGVSVVGGSSYVVKEKESKPVSGGSGGSTSGGSSSGGDVPSPSYAISNLHFEQSGDDYVLAWNGTGRDSFYYNVYLKLSEDSDWSYKGVTQDAKFKMDMLHSSKGVKVEAYINETDETPVAVAEDLSLEVNVTPVKSEADNLSAIFTKEGSQYSATFTGLPAGKFAVVLFQKGDTVDTPGQTADEAGNVSFLIPSDETDLIENGTYTIYSYDNYVLNGNQLSYTIYQHCEPTYCIPRSHTLSNIRFEKAQNGDEYYLAWDSSVTDGVFYKLYTTTNGGTAWGPQRYLYECKEKMQMLFSGNGFRIDLYKIGEDTEPIASAENLNISFDPTIASENLNNLSATFTKSDGHYSAEFSGLIPERQFAMHINGTNSNHEMFLIDSDAQGNATLEINSGFNGLIESGKYTIYSFGNYALDSNENRLSYTVYQHCEPSTCIRRAFGVLDIYTFVAKNEVVCDECGVLNFDGPYTVNLEVDTDVSHWFSGLPDGLHIYYKRTTSNNMSMVFELRGTPTTDVTNGIHYLNCVIPANTLLIGDELYPAEIMPNVFGAQIFVCDRFEYINHAASWIEWDKVEISDNVEELVQSLRTAVRSSENTGTDVVVSYNSESIDFHIHVSANHGYKFSENVGIDLSAYDAYSYEFETLVDVDGNESPNKGEWGFGIEVKFDIDKLKSMLPTTKKVAVPTNFKLKEADATRGCLLTLEMTTPIAAERAKIERVCVKTYKSETRRPFARTTAYNNLGSIEFPLIYDWLENDTNTTIYVEVSAEPTAEAARNGYIENSTIFSVTLNATGDPEAYDGNVVYKVQDDTLILTGLECSTYYQLFIPVADDNTVMSAWSDETGKSMFEILNGTIKQGEFSRFTLTTMRVVEVTDNSAKIERHIYTNEFPSRVTPER